MSNRRTHGLTRRAAALAAASLVAGLLAPAAAAVPAAAVPVAPAAHPRSVRYPPAAASTQRALARARATRRPIQVPQLTTATSTTTANPDGSLTLHESLAPQRALHGGKWAPLAGSLRRAGGRLTPALAAAPLSLSAGGSGPLFTMTANLRTLSMSWPTPLPAPGVSGATATYAGVLPGVNLVLTAGTTGSVAETIVVQNAAAAANPALASLQFHVSTAGLTLAASPAGNIWASAGPTATPLITAQPPLMWDSAPAPAGEATVTGPDGELVDAHSGMPAASSISGPGAGAHVATMGVSLSGSTLTLTPAAADLTGPGVVYPVYLDPNYINSAGTGASSWTQVDSGFPTTTYWKESSDLQVGYDNWPGNNGLGVARSFIQLPLASALKGATIGSANIDMDDVWSANGCTAEPIRLYATQGISSSTDWNTQAVKGFWNKYIEQESFAFGTTGCGSYKADVSWGTGSAATGGTSANQLASTLQYDVTQPGGWVTFGLQADSETNDLQWKQFTASAPDIWMTITYDKPPAAPDDLQASPGSPAGCQTSEADAALIGADDVTFSADVSDPDTTDSLTSEFTIHNASGSVPAGGDMTGIHTNGAGQPVTAQDKLTRAQMEALNANGQTQSYTYYWQAQSVNQYNTAGPWSEKCWFTYDPTGPATPDFTYPASAQMGTTFTITVTPPAGCGPAPAQPCPTSYTYQLGASPPAAVGSNDQATITMNQVGPVDLAVTGYTAGNPSPVPATHQLTGTKPATPLDNGYFAGGSYPSLLTLHAPGSATPALLLSPGTGNGTLGRAADIGSLGLGYQPGSDGPADWEGYVIAHGNFTGDNVQDVLAFSPANGDASIVPGTGTTATLTGTPTDIPYLSSGSLTNANGDNPASPNEQGTSPASQLVGAGDASGLSTGLDDLIGIAGDATDNNYELDLYTAGITAGGGVPGGYGYTATLSTTSPDGNSWGDYSLATVQAGGYPGGTANPAAVTLFALDTTNGSLYQTSTAPVVTISPTTGLPVAAALTWTHDTTSWGTSPPALVSADIAASGATELWTLTGGTATAYTLTGSTLTKDTTASPVGPAHDWPLTDDQLITADNNANGGTQTPPTTAADLTGSDPSTLSSAGVTWDDQSGNHYFSGDITVNGTSGYISPPSGIITSTDTTPAISVWFRTTTPGGVLVSLDSDPLTHGTTSSNPYDPVLYIGTDGKLYAEWWKGSAAPAVSSSAVDDGAWHHAVLIASGTSQTLYLDNQQPVTVTGTINLTTQGQQLSFGGGYIGGNWPAEPHNGGTPTADYFTGSITAITLS